MIECVVIKMFFVCSILNIIITTISIFFKYQNLRIASIKFTNSLRKNSYNIFKINLLQNFNSDYVHIFRLDMNKKKPKQYETLRQTSHDTSSKPHKPSQASSPSTVRSSVTYNNKSKNRHASISSTLASNQMRGEFESLTSSHDESHPMTSAQSLKSNSAHDAVTESIFINFKYIFIISRKLSTHRFLWNINSGI